MWTALRPAHIPTGEQNQKKRKYDVLPKPDKLIRYRQKMSAKVHACPAERCEADSELADVIEHGAVANSIAFQPIAAAPASRIRCLTFQAPTPGTLLRSKAELCPPAPHAQIYGRGDGHGRQDRGLGSNALAEFKESLRGRLMALARVRGLLSRSPSGDYVSFVNLVGSELSSRAEDGGTVTLDAPLKSAQRRRTCGHVDGASPRPHSHRENRTRRSGNMMCCQNRTS